MKSKQTRPAIAPIDSKYGSPLRSLFVRAFAACETKDEVQNLACWLHREVRGMLSAFQDRRDPLSPVRLLGWTDEELRAQGLLVHNSPRQLEHGSEQR